MTPEITCAELRQEYARTGLSRLGIPFETAVGIAPVRAGLEAAIKGQRRLAAKRAQAAAIPHQIKEAA